MSNHTHISQGPINSSALQSQLTFNNDPFISGYCEIIGPLYRYKGAFAKNRNNIKNSSIINGDSGKKAESPGGGVRVGCWQMTRNKTASKVKNRRSEFSKFRAGQTR